MPLFLQPPDSQKPDDPVKAALQKVNEAVNTAEKQLDKLDKLPSAQMPRQVCLNIALCSLTPVTKLTLSLSHQHLHHLCMKPQIPISSHFQDCCLWRMVIHGVPFSRRTQPYSWQ